MTSYTISFYDGKNNFWKTADGPGGSGSELIVADRFFPSSRLCRHCGCINSELKLSDREWTCDCGAIHDRDLNAAINLKNLATKLPRVPRKVTPVESDIRPTAVSLAASLKQEPSAESHGRFW